MDPNTNASPRPGAVVKPQSGTTPPPIKPIQFGPSAQPNPILPAGAPIPGQQPGATRRQRLLAWIKAHPRRSAAIAAISLLVVSAAGYATFKYLTKQPPAPPAETTAPAPPPAPPKPATKPSPLTGVELEPALAERPVSAVIIENHPNARPQSGLGQAGVVYEALAEGGITRFMALYLEQRAPALGPIRSVRTYFVDWALEFDAPVAHVGGNADALDLVAPLGLKSLTQFAHPGSYYRSRDRFAPHNAYTSSDLLDQLLAKLGFNQPAKFKPSPRKPDSPPAAGTAATAPTIGINYSYRGFQVEYRYDAATNSYARFMAGAPHVDRNDGKQIMAKNVVVQYMPTRYGVTRIGEATVIMGTPGSGQAVVFRDGGAVTGTWSKASHRERTVLKDTTGAEIPLNAGNTWYSIVPVGRSVSY
ncbi:DUF3048 domain-containing protein [Candidatus Parcubacteria bacterium]|nr:DUF3048 domain-containing protein [Candidatus Parcubacteria bacterium]